MPFKLNVGIAIMFIIESPFFVRLLKSSRTKVVSYKVAVYMTHTQYIIYVYITMYI